MPERHEAFARAERRNGHRRHPAALRVRTQSDPPKAGGDESDGGGEVAREAVVSSGDAAEILEAAKHALDDVASGVLRLVEGKWDLAGGVVGNDDERTALGGTLAQGSRIVALVADEDATWRGQAQQSGCGGDVGDVAGAEQEGEQPPLSVG